MESPLLHWSDCALHNGPAMRPRPCNCGVQDALRYQWLREQIKNKETMARAQALFWHYSSRREFDRAVDRAMKASKPAPRDRI